MDAEMETVNSAEKKRPQTNGVSHHFLRIPNRSLEPAGRFICTAAVMDGHLLCAAPHIVVDHCQSGSGGRKNMGRCYSAVDRTSQERSHRLSWSIHSAVGSFLAHFSNGKLLAGFHVFHGPSLARTISILQLCIPLRLLVANSFIRIGQADFADVIRRSGC
jgi:hypothetical protein